MVQEDKYYTHTQVVLTGLIPYFNTYLISGGYGFLPENMRMHGVAALSLLGNIPACIIDPACGITETIISAGSWSTSLVLSKYPEL
jgi:hypothetical protein